jgi:hypothetical protein
VSSEDSIAIADGALLYALAVQKGTVATLEVKKPPAGVPVLEPEVAT